MDTMASGCRASKGKLTDLHVLRHELTGLASTLNDINHSRRETHFRDTLCNFKGLPKKLVQEINSLQVAMREAEQCMIGGDFSEALRMIQFPVATAGPLSYLHFIQRNRSGKKIN